MIKHQYKTPAISLTYTFRILVALTCLLFSLVGCQSEEPVYFLDVNITNPNNCFFSSLSRDSKLLAMTCTTGEKNLDGHSQWNLLVSSTTEMKWLSLFSDENLPITFPVSAFSPDETMLAITDQDGHLWIFETGNWTTIHTFDYPWIAGELIWSPDSKSILVIGGGEIVVSVISLDGDYRYLLAHNDIYPGKDQITQFDHLGRWGVTWSPDGKQIAYVARITSEEKVTESQLWTLNVTSGKREMLYQGEIGGKLSWSPDGKKLAITEPSVVQIYDFQSRIFETVFRLKGTAFTNRIETPWAGPWSIDSSQIAFAVFNASDDENTHTDAGIYVLSLLNDEMETISHNRADIIQWTINNGLVIKNIEKDNLAIRVIWFP